MKLLIFSDTHGSLKNAENVLREIGNKMEAVLHLGDHDYDALRLQQKFPKIKFFVVRGNTDGNSNVPYETMVTFQGKKLLLTHGHRQQVHWNYDAISYFAQEKEADIVLFGHTHKPVNDRNASVMLFNPGSLSLPRNTNEPTFGILDISENGVITGTIMGYYGKNDFRPLEHLPNF